MPNPLSEAFQAAARVRPGIAKYKNGYVHLTPQGSWIYVTKDNSYPMTEHRAVPIVEAACMMALLKERSLPIPSGLPALLAAVAGLGGGE